MRSVGTTLFACALGVFFVLYCPSLLPLLKIFGIIYLRCLTALVIPLTAAVIFLAITSTLSAQHLAQLAKHILFFYVASSALACLTGIGAAHLVLTATPAISLGQTPTALVPPLALDTLVLSFFPDNLIGAFAGTNLLPVITLTFAIAFATRALPDRQRELATLLATTCRSICEKVLSWVLFFTPAALVCLLATILAKSDATLLKNLANFFAAVSLAALVHAFLTLPLMAWLWGGFSAYRYGPLMAKPLLLALTTASSMAALPASIEASEKKGQVDPRISGFALPLGATLNMDGSALYQALVAIFLAKLAGVPLDLAKEILIFLLVMLSSAGTAGIPSGGLILMNTVLATIGVPAEWISIYLLVDRFWDYPVTAINVWGDLIAVKAVHNRLATRANSAFSSDSTLSQ